MRLTKKALAALPLLLVLSPGCQRQESQTMAGNNPCASPGNQIIDIGSDGVPAPDCVDAKISKEKRHRVVWQSPDDTTLDIAFRASPAPLKVHCNGNTCKSEPVADDVKPDTYEYDTKVAPAPSAPSTTPPAPSPTGAPSPTPTRANATYGRIIIQK